MQPTIDNLQARRLFLREQLLKLAITSATQPLDILSQQIDALLEDVLDQTTISLPALAWTPDRNEDERIVVTGIGVLTPLGIGLDNFWNGLAAGRSGVAPITLCDPGDSPRQACR